MGLFISYPKINLIEGMVCMGEIFIICLFLFFAGCVIAGAISGIKQGNQRKSGTYSRNQTVQRINSSKSSLNSPPSKKLINHQERQLSTHNYQFSSLSISTELNVYEVEVKQKTPGVLPAMSLDTWDDYVSPSGGFVNYACFDVIGKNPETKRKNKRYIEAKDEADACKKMEEKGFIGPFETAVRPMEPPTDRQLEYAKSLGAAIPEGACKRDVSAIITRITENDEGPVSASKARAAFEADLKISRYSGTHEIMSLANSLPADEFSKILRA